MRVIREWAYDASSLSLGRAFLCGDSACFIDPLFSQGVHLATYSAMLAAAGIDHLYRNPRDAGEIHQWYEQSYREAYNRYHQFLAAFYSANSALDSTFWQQRKIAGAADSRFAGKEWFTALSGQQVDAGAQGVEELEARAATLADLWQHNKNEVTDHFDETELSLRRVRWASQLMKDFGRMARITWVCGRGAASAVLQGPPDFVRARASAFHRRRARSDHDHLRPYRSPPPALRKPEESSSELSRAGREVEGIKGPRHARADHRPTD